MEQTHHLSLPIGGRSYPIELQTITGRYAGGQIKQGNDYYRETLFLEQADGKAIKIYSEFNNEIPSGSAITLIRAVDKRKEVLYSFALYIHATDDVKWLDKSDKSVAIRRLLTLTKGQGRRYYLRNLWALLATALLGWLGLWLGEAVADGHLLGALADVPYVLTSPGDLLSHGRMSFIHGLMGAAAGFIGARLVCKWPLDLLFSKANDQLVDALMELRPKLDQANLMQQSGLSGQADDGYRDMFETA
ncbi:hypothetical protein [Ferrimonas gelatinilytica]|uniref:Uncharacterized protein n=1 Tax=Ferrimonas gelatinilytica TaxID=1255257 RepID=A0ABP9SCS5_9GAMM